MRSYARHKEQRLSAALQCSKKTMSPPSAYKSYWIEPPIGAVAIGDLDSPAQRGFIARCPLE